MLPAGYLPTMLNMTANKQGFLQSRQGSAKASNTNLGSAVHSQGRIIVQGTSYVYQGAGTSLYRAYSAIATGFSGNPLIMRDGGPDFAVTPYEIIWDSLQRMKDNGTAVTNFGIAGPLQMASAVAAAITSKTIDLFEYATDGAIQAAWPTIAATVTHSATSPAQGTYAGNLNVAASTTGYMTLTSAFNLNLFSVAGDSTDNDYIAIYMRVDNAARISEVRLMFDVDPAVNDFAHNFYWKSIQPNLATGAAQGTVTAEDAYTDVVTDVALGRAPQSTVNLVNTLPPERLTLGTSQWLQIFIKKKDFTRVGTHSNDWANVAAVRIQVTTNAGGAINLGVDDLIMQSGDNLDADDLEWIYRYRSEVTATTSPFSPLMRATVEISKTNATVTVRNPRDTQATHIELFRRGGDSSIFAFATEKVVTVWSGTTTITDSTPDSELGDTADLSQVELANLAQGPSAISTSVRKTTNIGVAYTDYTAAVGDDNPATYADLSSLDTLANGDWLVVGADGPFRQILLIFAANNVNLTAATLTVQYWNGTTWRSAFNPVDGSAKSGKTLGQTGTIEFDFPDDWAVTTIDSVDAYYVRLSVSAALSAAVHITELRIGANAFDPTTFEVFGGRVWSNDSRHTDRVWYSERLTPEIFLAENFVSRSHGGDPIVRPFGLDDQLFVFTGQTADRLIGSTSESFQLIPTATEVGLFSAYPICKGRNRIYHRGYDGIYALPGSGFSEKISLSIDPIFHGYASQDGRMQPIDQTKASTEAMEFSGAKLWFAYTDIDGTRQEITYDFDVERWEPSDRKATSYLRLDDVAQFYSGNSDGYVYQRLTGETDEGAAIALRFATEYVDMGEASRDKQFTEIAVDCDLAGETLTFYADFNNGVDDSQSFQLTNSERGIVYLPLEDDTQGRNVSLRLDSNNGGSNVKFYKVTFFHIPLRPPATKLPTEWDDLGYPGDKRLQQLVVDLDTQGSDVSIAVQVSGATTETLTVNTVGRQIVPFSLAADTIGKLTRLILSGASPFRYYSHRFDFLKDPIELERYDTVELDFSYTRWKFIRRLWIAAQTPNVVTVKVYVDEVLRFTSPPLLIESNSGWTKYELKLPPGLKGKTFRFVFTASGQFKLFLDQSDVEWHPLASDRGYQRAALMRQA